MTLPPGRPLVPFDGGLVRGDTGSDSAQTDALTGDEVETIDAASPPPVADARALLPTLGHIAVVHSHGHPVARVRLSCPAAETGGWQTTLTLIAARTVRLGRVRATVVLARAA
jgi:hypothetical protein